MNTRRPKFSVIILALFALAGSIGFVLAFIAEDRPMQTLTAAPMHNIKTTEELASEEEHGGAIMVPGPPFSDGIFPCSDCHSDMDVDRTRRTLVEEHENIVLKHDEKNRWCLDCHNADDRDKLHLASGALIEFSESYKLCGQCHGPKLRDWKAGAHGKRTGNWQGEKRYLLCVHCHNPHAPRFQPIAPEPAPQRPKKAGE